MAINVPLTIQSISQMPYLSEYSASKRQMGRTPFPNPPTRLFSTARAQGRGQHLPGQASRHCRQSSAESIRGQDIFRCKPLFSLLFTPKCDIAHLVEWRVGSREWGGTEGGEKTRASATRRPALASVVKHARRRSTLSPAPLPSSGPVARRARGDSWYKRVAPRLHETERQASMSAPAFFLLGTATTPRKTLCIHSSGEWGVERR